jgi:hypothetical protein
MLAIDLQTTQGDLRMSPNERNLLKKYVKDGGVFDTCRIIVDRFPDGAIFVRDGHHRVAAVVAARAGGQLREEEVVITDRTYDMYIYPDILDGWITPFDPRTQVRIANIIDFKNTVSKFLRAGHDASGYISANTHLYCRPRTAMDTFQRLASDL